MNKFLLLWLCLFSVFSLGAIDIYVEDADLQLPLEGVRVTGAGLEAVTGPDGRAVLDLPQGRHRLTLTLPGYDRLRITVDASQSNLEAKLRIAGVLQGEELVVERRAPRTSDAESGVSVAVGQEEFRATAQIGIVEDVMSSIKTLPGVGYAGGWNAAPSIRGGSPLETTFVMDGYEVLYPYHWGGSFTIFNPNMVAAAKLSAGLVSARYGRLLSGMIEITTRRPEDGETRFDGSLTTTGLDLYLDTAAGDDMGFILGGKMTWMEVSFALAGQAGFFDRVPYIYDGFGKWTWDPSPLLKLDVTGFIGLDGVGTKNNSTEGFPSTVGMFEWTNLTTFGALDLRWLASDKWQITVNGGYGYHYSSPDVDITSSGFQAYSQTFLDKYDGDGVVDLDGVNGLINGAFGFSVDGTYFRVDVADTDYNGQLRLDAAFNPAEGQSFQFGFDGFFRHSTSDQTLEGYRDFQQGGVDYYTPVTVSAVTEGNKILSTAGYALYAWGKPKDIFTGEAGLRVDHSYLWSEGYDLQTWPVFNPRLRLTFQPVTSGETLQHLGFTVGGGLFSKIPFFAEQIDKEYGIEDFEVGPDRNWMALAGVEVKLDGGWRFTLEGYVKNYLQRVYINSVPGTNPVEIEVQTDGQGWVWGFDALLQKTEGRYFDGYLTYTYVMTRLLNPSGQGETTYFGSEPIGEWFYPSYHRFHSVNLIANIKPWDFLTLSIKGSLASGAPKLEVGDPEVYAAYNGTTVVERWRQPASYSDTLRNDLSCPVDIKILFSYYFAGTKVRFENYFGVENVFAFFYTPKTNKSIDSWTGKELSGSGEAEFTIGVPIPSFGVRLSY